MTGRTRRVSPELTNRPRPEHTRLLKREDDDVDAAERCHGCRHGTFHIGGGGDIGMKDSEREVLGSVHRLKLGIGCLINPERGNGRALPGQMQGDGPADTRRSGDHRDFAGKFMHRLSPVLLPFSIPPHARRVAHPPPE